MFRDIDRISPGERFPRVIEREVGSCQALLAVIGSRWLSIEDDAGQRRLDDPDDYVRLEIAAALGRGADVLVIPVLVGPTSMPAAADLPMPLASLAECNAVRLSDETWKTRWHALPESSTRWYGDPSSTEAPSRGPTSES